MSGVKGAVSVSDLTDGQRSLRSRNRGGRRRAVPHACRTQFRCNAVERLADNVEIDDPPAVDRRHADTALARLDQQTASLQDLNCMADRLSRDAEHLGNAVLREASTGRQCAIGDRRQQAIVDPIDQSRLQLQFCDRHGTLAWLCRALVR